MFSCFRVSSLLRIHYCMITVTTSWASTYRKMEGMTHLQHHVGMCSIGGVGPSSLPSVTERYIKKRIIINVLCLLWVVVWLKQFRLENTTEFENLTKVLGTCFILLKRCAYLKDQSTYGTHSPKQTYFNFRIKINKC